MSDEKEKEEDKEKDNKNKEENGNKNENENLNEKNEIENEKEKEQSEKKEKPEQPEKKEIPEQPEEKKEPGQQEEKKENEQQEQEEKNDLEGKEEKEEPEQQEEKEEPEQLEEKEEPEQLEEKEEPEEKEEKEEKKEEEEKSKKSNQREEYVYLSKLYERAERFPDMVSSINKFIELNPKLSKEEKNILSAGYKNILSDKRASWRLLNSMEKKEAKKKPALVPYIKEIKSHIENELKEQIEKMKNLIDKYLLPNAEDSESKIFYLRLKADHIRYLCEMSKDKEFEKACEETEKIYKEAYDIAIKDLPVINSTRVGLCLNFAVFYYEVKGNKKEGCKIAKKAFEDSMKYLDDLEKFKSKDVLLLIQLLKENLIFWSSEMSEEE